MLNFLRFLETNLEKEESLCVVTVTNTKGSTPRDLGARMIVGKSGLLYGTIGGGFMEFEAIKKAQELLQGKSKVARDTFALCIRNSQCCGGSVEVLMELIQPKPKLFIFGAGHVAQSLCHVLKDGPFDIFCWDERAEWSELLPNYVTSLSQPLKETLEHKALIGKNYALIMTHDHHLDFAILSDLISRSFSYLGLIGSLTKRQRFLQRLNGLGLLGENSCKLHCPIGIPLDGSGKAKTPVEIAISVAAELIQVYYGQVAESKVVGAEDPKEETIKEVSEGNLFVLL